MTRFLRAFVFIISLVPLFAYTPPENLNGNVRSVRTYKVLLHDVPAGTREEPWFPNADFDEQSRVTIQRYYEMGQEYRRHEFRYETDEEDRERKVWVTYFITPDLKPPFERLAGYEHWYTLKEGDDPNLAVTHFETVMSHPVKSVYRYYDGEGRLVHESDTFQDLDVKISFDGKGRLRAKRGYRGEETFWEERYLYDDEGRLKTFIQTDLNRQLYERGEYNYEEGRVVYNKYVLDHPVTEEMESSEPLGTPVFQSIKDYEGQKIIRLRNYNWNGPMGMKLTQEQLYGYDTENRLARVEEPHSQETWTLSYDDRGNWITLTFADELNRPEEKPITWKREITYY